MKKSGSVTNMDEELGEEERVATRHGCTREILKELGRTPTEMSEKKKNVMTGSCCEATTSWSTRKEGVKIRIKRRGMEEVRNEGRKKMGLLLLYEMMMKMMSQSFWWERKPFAPKRDRKIRKGSNKKKLLMLMILLGERKGRKFHFLKKGMKSKKGVPTK